MGSFTIPDETHSAQGVAHTDLAEPKSRDFEALAQRDTGVKSGCAVTPQGTPDMTLAVASGVVRIAGVDHSVTSGNVTITPNSSGSPRYDAVVVNTSGTKSVIAGTPGPETTLDDPAIDLTAFCWLAKVYVASGVTAITATEFVSKAIPLDVGVLDDTQIPSGVARDAEVTAAITAHAADVDPHAGYRLESAAIGTSDLANDAVTYAKMQNVSATSRILGRITAGAGDTEELTAAQVKTLLGSGGVLPVFSFTDYGAVGNGSTDDTTACQAAFAAAAVAGGVVYIPPGTFRITASLVPYSGLTLMGAGMGVSILKPTGTTGFSAIQGTASSGTPFTDITLRDFQVDGSAITGTYAVETKAISIKYLRRGFLQRIYAHDCGATGIAGLSWKDSVIANCVSNANGRLNDGTQPGSAGIGIGSGNDGAIENLLITGCHTSSNVRCGIFIEQQTSGTLTSGTRIIGCTANSNQYGIADAGNRRMQIIGCTTISNSKSGIASFAGTLPSGSTPGEETSIQNCVSVTNTEHGIHIDTTALASIGRYHISGNRCSGNTLAGIKVEMGSAALPHVAISGNESHSNSAQGIDITGTGPAQYVSLMGNRAWNNALSGIRINSDVTELVVEGNHLFDSAGTPTQNYGLEIVSGKTVTGGRIANNRYATNQTADVLYAGTLTSVQREGTQVVRIKRTGTLTVLAGATKVYNDSGQTLYIQKIRGSVETAPTGADIIVDVNVSGGTIMSGTKVVIAATTTTGTQTTFSTSTIADGAYFTIDVDQIGSTIAGADLLVEIVTTRS